MEDKPIIWIGTSKVDLRALPEDLGFEPIEAANLKPRADLILKLREFIRSQHWTLEQAASHFDEPVSRISNLMNADIEHFCVDRLVRLLE